MSKKFFLKAVVALLLMLALQDTLYYVFYRIEQELLEYRIMLGCRDYESRETPYCKIYYTKADSEFIPLIARTIDSYSNLLAKDFGIEPAGQITAVVYPSEGEFQKNLRLTSVPIGLYYGGALNFLSPRAWAGTANEWEAKNILLEQGPIIHELTHYYTDRVSQGRYDIWFAEGIALYYEYKYTGFEWCPDLRGVSETVSYLELEKNFTAMNKALAYRCAFEYVNNVVLQKGEESLKLILHRQGQGQSFKQACVGI